MKMSSRYIIATACVVLACQGTVSAQQKADTIDFNALKYSMQKHHRPQDEAFVPYTFFYIQAGTEQMIQRTYSDYGWGPVGREVLGMRFDKYNSVAIVAEASTARQNLDAARIFRGGIGLQHYFDITSYVGGYRPSRTVSLSTVEQLNYFRTRHAGVNGKAFGLRGGLVVAFRLTDTWHINLEPYAAIYNDKIVPAVPFNWRKFQGSYGLTAGISHNFDYRHCRNVTEPQSFGQWFVDNSFVSVAAGVQGFGDRRSITKANFFETLGEHVSISYGRYLKGPLGLRLSTFMSRNEWDNVAGASQKSNLFGFRGEVMFDPLYYVNIKKGDSKFSTPLFLGPEAAHFSKKGSDFTLDKWYMGLTTGLQFKVKVSRTISLFVEPRLSLSTYTSSANELDGEPVFKNYFDTLLSASAGIEVRL